MTRVLWFAALFFPAVCYTWQDTNQQPPPKQAAPKEAPKKKTPRAPKSAAADRYGAAKIARDDTGYIESAFIQSLVRFRFDAAFDDQNIDLANYFYGSGIANDVAKLNYREYHLKVEYAFTGRFSAFLDTPIRTLSPTVSFVCAPECTDLTQIRTLAPANNQSFTGLGDLRTGVKVGLLNHPNEHLTFQLATSIPTGNLNRGLGTGNHTIEPYLLLFVVCEETDRPGGYLWLASSGTRTPWRATRAWCSTRLKPARGRTFRRM